MSIYRWTLPIVAGALACFVQAAAAKGKPGGGNPPPVPPGTIYFQVEGDGVWAMDAGGGSKARLFTQGPGNEVASPSHLPHGGMRWFLVNRQTADVLPDGTLRRELVARSDTGSDVVLWSVAGVDVRPDKVWARDDSFLAFKVSRPADGIAQVIQADVDWSGGAPALGTNTAVLLERALVTPPWSQTPLVTIREFDFSPDGALFVYGETDYVAGGITLYLEDLATGSTTPIGQGRRPEWSADGDRIAFQGETTGVHTMRPDGSDVQEVRATGEQPVWSPDGAWLALTATITTGKGSKTKTADEVLRVASSGGSEQNLTTDTVPNVRALGWR